MIINKRLVLKPIRNYINNKLKVLSGLNLGGKFSVLVINPLPHIVWQAVLQVFRQGSNYLLDISFALFGNPFNHAKISI